MWKRRFKQRWPWLVAAGLSLIALVWMLLPTEQSGDWDRRARGSAEDIQRLRERDDLNVLFILVDTLRAERLGSYGYERDTSPVIDRMARSGVRFQRHLAQSTWTKASMASLWTGLYPVRTGVTRYDDVIPDSARMAAESLREAGFQTIGLYRNGWVAPTFGFDQGFEVYERPAAAPLPPKIKRENPTLSDSSSDVGVIEAAQEFLRVNGKQRWFLYLHLMDLHQYMYDEESALFGPTYSDSYDNSIRWTDASIEILLETLAEQGLLENTIVALVSDHGEAFLERGFEGHARRVYREEAEIPFVLSLPFRLEPGVIVGARTQNVDVWPTLLDLLGLPPLEGVDGRSLLPDILASASGQSPDGAGRIAISDLNQNWAKRDSDPLPTISVVDGEYRYVRIERVGGKRIEQLFDAGNDPREVRDRAAEDPKTLERLRGEADAYYKEQPAWGDAPTREIGELELNLLRALGYKVD